MSARIIRQRRVLAAVLVMLLSAMVVAFLVRSTPSTSTLIAEAAAVKLLVAEPGIVAVTPDDLRAAGWQNVDLSTLRVKSQAEDVPVRVDGGVLRFYAPISPTLYMSETVFWLEQRDGSALRITDQSPIELPGVLNPLDHYTATARFAENHVYAPQPVEGDHWFAAQLPAPISRTFTLTATSPVDGSGQVLIETWASTEAPANPDHRYRLTLNDRALGEWTWDGQGRHALAVDIPIGLLRDGTNLITIEAPGVTGVSADTTFLDRITLEYPRRFVAEHDRLEFISAGGRHALTGFSGPIDVYDVTQPDRMTRTRLNDGAIVSGEAGHQYWAVGPQGDRSARVQAARLTPDLRAGGNAAQYLAIGPSDLLEPLQPLLAWRAAQGLPGMAVPVEAIYDQFGEGRVDPEAIRSFLRYAAQQWAVKPQYVLLVGDASYDTLSTSTPPQANRVPTFLVQTVFGGETASDVGFAQLDEDEKPDVAIGRVPAREAEQVRTFVDKTLAYEKNAPAGEWRSRVLAVADGQEPSFREDAQRFLDQFKPGYQTNLVNPPAGAPQASAEIVRDLNEGSALVGYFGHGSVTQWGKDNLFAVKDGAALQNDGRLPVVINMTCLTGLFTHPKVQSLAEALLLKSDGGAAAVLAPTSLTLASDQSVLSNALVQAYMKDRTARLGDVFLQAQREVSASDSGTRDVLRTFLLFGDPALKLVQP